MKIALSFPVTLTLLLVGACSAFENSGGDDALTRGTECPIGSRGCPCTTGSACDPDLTCINSLCVRTNSGSTGGGAATGGGPGTGVGGAPGGTGPADLCKDSTDAAFEACPIEEQYRQAILDDCENRRAGQPAACLAAYDTALACEGAPSAWTCNAGGDEGEGTVTASPTGCDALVAVHADCLAAAAPLPTSCAETGTYCESNVLRDCATKDVVRSCASCKWIGPGTGSEYDTTCKAKAADCTVCDSSSPWTGPGCYYGGGPRVCG